MTRLTIERTMLVTVFVLLVALATRIPVDTDTWWHLRSGEYTLTQGMIYTDPFSFTFEGERWINHSWGSQIVLYGVYSVLGNPGLALYTSLLAAGGMAFLYMASAGSVYLRAFILVLGAAAAAVFWSARPQMFSFFFTCVWIFLIYDFKRRDRDRLWIMVPLMVLWANLHAGYSIGFLFLFAAIVGEAANVLFTLPENRGWRSVRKLFVITVLCVAALLLTPYGVDTLRVPFETVGIGALRDYIQEWRPPNFQGRETWPFIGLLIALIGAAWAGRLAFDWTGFFLIGGTLFLALLYGRNIAVFAVAATPILTHHLDSVLNAHGWQLRTRQQVTRSQGRLNAVLIAVVVFGALVYVLGALNPRSIAEAQNERLPVAAADFIRQNQLQVPMFNSYNWGGYLMFALPDYPVFIDGRTDLYGDFLRVYLDTATGQDSWQQTLDAYDIRLVVVENGSGLDHVLETQPDWELAFQDELAVIYTREGGA